MKKAGSLAHLIACGLALWLVTLIFPGKAGFDNFGYLAAAAALLWLIDLTIKPVLKILSIPIGCLTLGLSNLLINIGAVWLAVEIMPGIHIDGFWVLLIASLLVSISSSLLYSGKKKK